MKTLKYSLFFLAVGLIFLCGMIQDKQETVKWYTFEEAVKLNSKKPKKIFIDVYTNWCGWCKRMDATTFNHPEIAQYLNEKFYPVKLNAETKDSILFNGKKYGFVPQYKANEFAATLLSGQMSYPTVVFLDEKLGMLQAIPGYRNAKDFDVILKFLGDDNYKTVDWQSFSTSYESNIK